MATDDWPTGRPLVRYLEHCGLWWANCIWCGGHWPGRTMQEAQDTLLDAHLREDAPWRWPELDLEQDLRSRVTATLDQATDRTSAARFWHGTEFLRLSPVVWDSVPRCSVLHGDDLESSEVQCTADP